MVNRKKPKISVLMPVYNAKTKWLKESINSILNQSFPDFELIILDDGSKKDVGKIINTFDDKRIKFYKNEKNMGVANTRNKLIDLANGEFIAFQDSDDISVPERIEKEYNFLLKHPEYIGVSAGYETFPNKEIFLLPEKVNFLTMLKYCCFAQPVCMIRLEPLKKYELKYNPDFKTGEDYELWSRLIRYGKLANLQEVLLKYRVHEDSLFHSDTTKVKLYDDEVKKNMLDYITYNEEYKKLIYEMVFFSDIKYSFFEKIFSIKKRYSRKIVTIFGHRFYINKKADKCQN